MEFRSMRELFAELKKDLKCDFCGENHPAVLETHYTSMCIQQENIDRFGERRETVLCANCHKKLHYDDSIDHLNSKDDALVA